MSSIMKSVYWCLRRNADDSRQTSEGRHSHNTPRDVFHAPPKSISVASGDQIPEDIKKPSANKDLYLGRQFLRSRDKTRITQKQKTFTQDVKKDHTKVRERTPIGQQKPSVRTHQPRKSDSQEKSAKQKPTLVYKKVRTFIATPRREPTKPALEKTETKILLASERDELEAKKNQEKKGRYTTKDAVGVYQSSKTKTNLTKKSVNSSPRDHKAVESPYSDTRSTIPPWRRKEYVLNKREATMYLSIKKTYNSDKVRKNRINQFFNKLVTLQLEAWKRNHMNYTDQQYKKMESKFRQQLQLKEVREKFNQDQVRRFKNQYVTGKVLEHEWSTRHLYGLPEDINADPQRRANVKPHLKKPKETFSFKEHHEKNINRFTSMFRSPSKSVWAMKKEPKMVDVDIVELEKKNSRQSELS